MSNAVHLTSLVSYFAVAIALLYDFVFLALFIIILINGFKYLFSGINPDLKEKSRKGLEYAVIGLIVIVLAYIIIVFIAGFVSPQFSSSFIHGSTLNFSFSNLGN